MNRRRDTHRENACLYHTKACFPACRLLLFSASSVLLPAQSLLTCHATAGAACLPLAPTASLGFFSMPAAAACLSLSCHTQVMSCFPVSSLFFHTAIRGERVCACHAKTVNVMFMHFVTCIPLQSFWHCRLFCHVHMLYAQKNILYAACACILFAMPSSSVLPLCLPIFVFIQHTIKHG